MRLIPLSTARLDYIKERRHRDAQQDPHHHEQPVGRIRDAHYFPPGFASW